MSFIILETVDISPLLNAYDFLNSALLTAKTDLEKTGTIKAFEFCYELSWKTMKRVLAKEGKTTTSPREVFRASAQRGLIKDPEIWFGFIEMRNLTSHTYDKDTAKKVLNAIPEFLVEADAFISTLKSLNHDSN